MPRITRQEGSTLVVLGPGAVDDLRDLLGRLGSTRPYLVTGPHLATGSVGARVREVLGDGLVGSYTGSRPHVPARTADEVAKEAHTLRADALVGLGGGSPIGTAKAAASRLQELDRSGPGSACFVAAIPTTYAGSEVTPVFGTTDLERGRKSVVRSEPIRPRLALYDPELALETPPDLTASTGVNALAHGVEGLYSREAGEAERAMALRAAARILEYLPRAVKEPKNLLYRYRIFEGSMEAGRGIAKAGNGVHHGRRPLRCGRKPAPPGRIRAINM